jgi:hypothetical protein
MIPAGVTASAPATTAWPGTCAIASPSSQTSTEPAA